MADFKEWEGFEGRLWKEGIDEIGRASCRERV